MRTRASARQLAERLVQVTRSMGLASSAVLTDMNRPLGVAVGNALEVAEAVEVLHGRGPADVRELTLDLATRMLRTARAESDSAAARGRAERALESGAAWTRFLALVEAQGGDPRALEPGGLASAPIQREVKAPRSGVVGGIDTFSLGELSVAIGAGRRSKEDAIDPRVGFLMRVRIGDRVEAGAALAVLHLARDDESAVARFASCVRIEDAPAPSLPLVLESID